MFRISFYVPEDGLELVKAAMFEAGAGRFDEYEQVCWQTLGVGQFKPLEGSNPAIGERGELTMLDEYKVEMVCEEAIIEQVVAALIEAHPYEDPAFEVLQMAQI